MSRPSLSPTVHRETLHWDVNAKEGRDDRLKGIMTARISRTKARTAHDCIRDAPGHRANSPKAQMGKADRVGLWAAGFITDPEDW